MNTSFHCTACRALIVNMLCGVILCCATGRAAEFQSETIECDLLVVGGTESGCAAAVQAARMGVKKIVLVNDIEWLGGQFSAEALGAIDENRAHDYNGKVPIPRSGIFRDVIDAIEAKNAELYGGIKRPGNTRVITTSRPVVSEAVFRKLLAPYEKSGHVVRYSNYRLQSVLTNESRVIGVQFVSTESQPQLTVRARLTIDASDWGDVIQGSGAKWDAGVDAKSEFNEPSAPDSADPATDMNPITWCMILEEREQETLFPKPENYDSRYFTGKWGWIDEPFAYTSRRLVDGHGFEEIDHPDVLLINTPPVDYPLDVYPAHVAAALEKTKQGASKKSIVAMTPQQREIVFQDARKHSLKFYYYLQQSFPKFRRMGLSDEFGTADKLPPKPYIRESLRLESQHIIREQEVIGFGGRSNYATTMFPDAVFSWQFELDFHPTRRSWTTDLGERGPWEAVFRGKRAFGNGGTGRCVFPLRALVPRDVDGLLAAQKNLGYTSIVSSSCRLHDQSIHAGQASGAAAAVSLRHGVSPAQLYLERERIEEIWTGLLDVKSGAPLAIWPFADVDPFDPGFVAIQQLALRRLLALGPADTSFDADKPATKVWLAKVLTAVDEAGYESPSLNDTPPATRRDAAIQIWAALAKQPTPAYPRNRDDDADADGIADECDALPYTAGEVSWQRDPRRDGVPDVLPDGANLEEVLQFNFATADAKAVEGFTLDAGAPFDERRGFGWDHDMTASNRMRHVLGDSTRDGFVFTRDQATWECRLPNNTYRVTLCCGDAEHPQPGQRIHVEGKSVVADVNTAGGEFHEATTTVEVADERLTVALGPQKPEENTTINWLRIVPVTSPNLNK